MKTLNYKNYLLLLVFMLCSSMRGIPPYNSQNKTKMPIYRSELRTLSDKAVLLAESRLAKNPKDNTGLMLLKFAGYFSPDNRQVLLLRGKLHYKVKIANPKDKFSSSEFLVLLKKALNRVSDKNSPIAHHLTAIFSAMIRLFEPADENAIVTLTNFRDQGFTTELTPLFERDLQQTRNLQYDKNDRRYIISNTKKSIVVSARQPWTDTFVKVEAGKFVKVKAFGTWKMGDVGNNIPICDADGYANFNPLDPNSKKVSNKKKKKKKIQNKKYYKSSLQSFPGSLLAKIGKKSYPVGRETVFRAETSGILYFGPYEWADYSDNSGSLQVSFEISDK